MRKKLKKTIEKWAKNKNLTPEELNDLHNQIVSLLSKMLTKYDYSVDFNGDMELGFEICLAAIKQQLQQKETI